MKKDEFKNRYGPWALIAGGSEGLGAAFAEEIAGRGLNLVLVARRAEPLEETAGKMRFRFGIEARAVRMDMSKAGFLSELQHEIEDIEIGLLVCNAAVAGTGPFLETPLDEYERVLDTNCRAHLGLIHSLSGHMARRGSGGIIVMSSMAGFQGSPFVTVYGATKAFLINLAEGLWGELSERGVDVTVCCPAAIRTPNYTAGNPAGKGRSPIESDPEAVAAEAVRALGRKPLAIPGAPTRLAHFMMSRLLSRRAAVSMMAGSTKKMYGAG